MHSDVGGGYPDHEITDVRLVWMVNRARKCGLAFRAEGFAQLRMPADPSTSNDDAIVCTSVHPDPRGDLHESREKLYRLVSPYHRSLGVADPAHEYVALSAVERREKRLNYTPGNLDTYLTGSPRFMPVPSHLRSSPDRQVISA